ncbi:MAG: PAS domain S-box protein [Ignavibacteria bacterium]|nr:PAS domain S-box protein [Ignavibacteria bacterium]
MKSSDKKFLEIFDIHGAVMLIIDPDSGKIIRANNSAERFYGYKKDEFSKMSIQDINTLAPGEVAEKRKQAAEEKQNYFIFKHKTAGNIIRDVQVYSYPMVFDDNQVLYSIVYDITDKLKAETELKENESQLSSLFESTNDRKWAVDTDYRLIKGNKKFLEYYELLTGRTLLKGESVLQDCIKEEINLKWKGYYDRTLMYGERFQIETTVKINEDKIFYEYNFFPITEDDGKVSGVVVTGHDITEHKKTRKKLNYKIQNESVLLQNISMALYSAPVNPNEDTMWTSDNIVSVTGFSRNEFKSKPYFWRERIHPEDKERVINAFTNIGTSMSVNVEYRWKVKSGEYRWFHDIANVIKTDTQEIYSGFLIDITENKAEAEEKRETEEKFKKIFKYSAVGKAIVDLNGKFLEVNDSFCKIVGYSPEELSKMFFKNITHPEDLAKGYQFVKDLENGKIEFGYQEKRYIHKDGHVVWAILSLSIMKDTKGVPLYLVAQIQDITDRKNVETLLAEREVIYRAVVNSSSDGIILQEKTGKIITWNEGAEEVFGIPEEEAVGINSLGIKWDTFREDGSQYPPEEHPSMITLKTGKPLRDEIMSVKNRNDGTLHWISVNTNPLFRENENSAYAVAITFSDITERKEYIDNLKNSEERYRTLINNANEAIYVVQNFKIVFANKMTEYLSGYSGDELIGMDIMKLVGKSEVDYLKKHHSDLLAGVLNNDTFTIPVITKNNNRRFIKVNAVKIDYNGSPATLNLAADITMKTRTEELFKARMNILEYSEGYCMDDLLQKTIDEAERITDSKIGFYHFVQDDMKSLTLQQWSTNTKNYFCKAIPDEKHYSLEKAGVWADCAREGRVIIHNEFSKVQNKKGMPSGHADVFRELTVPIMRGGKVVAILGVGNKETDYNEYDVSSVSQLADLAWDITQKKLSEEYLINSENNLRKLNEEKDKFFSIIAHDLRSPFTAFIGLTETIAENINSLTLSEITSYLNRINDAAVNLFGLLNNLLEWSLNQRGLSSFEPKDYDLKKIIEESIESLEESIKRKNINVSFVQQEDIHLKVDKSMFETIMRNLISNAVKFNHRGGNLNISAGYGKKGNVDICVEDTGIGMDDDLMNKIFNIAEKTKRPGTEGEPSSGLGLPLCKEYVEKHGGTISIESEQDKGTTICVTLPIGN